MPIILQSQGPLMDENGRAEPRSSLLLAAKLRATGGSAMAVTIRNLSSTGALVEAPRVPGTNTDVELVRGELACRGAIAWARPGRCGIRFHAPIDVAAWVPARILSADQQRVDNIQASLKAGETIAPVAFGDAGGHQPNTNAWLADELGFVSRLLEALGDELATDHIVARHGVALQNLDIAIQLLGHLADVLRAPDPSAAIKQIGMDELRRRLSRKAL